MVHINSKYVNEDGTFTVDENGIPEFTVNQDGLAVLGFMFRKALPRHTPVSL